MKNFPHQVNSIQKLRASLAVAVDLLQRGESISDDGVFGYTLARREIYTFRGLDHPSRHALEQRMVQEQTKLASNQGPRTFARDLRRTLMRLAFLQEHDDQLTISDFGTRLLELPDPPNPEASALWINAILRLELETDRRGGVTHPAMNMLRIIQAIPGIEKRWLAFSLDMDGDSRREFRRILRLIQSGRFERACRQVGATQYEAANAVKIIPALLEQVGLISIDQTRCTLTDVSERILNQERPLTAEAAPTTPAVPPIPGRRLPRPGRVVTTAEDIPLTVRTARSTRSEEEQLHTALALKERTTLHQLAVHEIVTRLRNCGETRTSEDAFDILALPPGNAPCLLIEVKTVKDDGLLQARIALGQLLFYEFFDVPTIAPGRVVVRIVVFAGEPGQAARAFLAAYNVNCVTLLDGAITLPPALQLYLG